VVLTDEEEWHGGDPEKVFSGMSAKMPGFFLEQGKQKDSGAYISRDVVCFDKRAL